MSRPRYRWWGFVKRMIRDYRGLKVVYDDLHSQSITANTSGMPKGGGNGRAIESITMRRLPEDDQKAYDAVSRAVELTSLLPDGKDRLDLIRYVYWCKKSHNIKDAALLCHVSGITAKRWHGDFVRLVGQCFGFSVKDDTPEPKECGKIVESK